MKKLFLVITLMVLLPSVLAINIEFQKNSQNEVFIADLEKPVVFNLIITNNGLSDSFEFYNLAGFSILPATMTINNGQTKDFQLELMPIGKISQRGYYTIPLFIRSKDSSEVEESLTFNIIELKDAFEIGSGDVDPKSQSISIYIKNRENFDFGNTYVKFNSAFFNVERSFTIGPKETKQISIQLNKEDFKSLMAGFYTLTADITTTGKEASVEGVIRFVEKDILTTTKKNYGVLINTQIITKTNEGNLVATSETVIKKNIISRLFTGFSPTPDIVERDGSTVYYSWTREINPGEALIIEVKTNWIFPFLLVLLIIVIVVLVKRYTRRSLLLKKRVSFVRAKGGEFALKISITVKAKQFIERVNVVDRLPMMATIHEKFYGDQPSRVDERNKRIEWNFDKMEAGEIRFVSYIIYSKIGVVGKFALPTTTAIFEKDEKIHEVESNRAFFVAEQRAIREE